MPAIPTEIAAVALGGILAIIGWFWKRLNEVERISIELRAWERTQNGRLGKVEEGLRRVEDKLDTLRSVDGKLDRIMERIPAKGD